MNSRRFYGDKYNVLRNTMFQTKKKLKLILKELQKDPNQFLVEHISTRIKSPASVKNKCDEKSIEYNAKMAIENIKDIIGIRLVTHFIGDVYMIRDAIYHGDTFEVVEEKDYIKNPKHSGYRSIHMIVLADSGDKEIGKIKVEIQIRTIAMDSWAALEHQIKYKKQIKNDFIISTELKNIANNIMKNDIEMEMIKNKIEIV